MISLEPHSYKRYIICLYLSIIPGPNTRSVYNKTQCIFFYLNYKAYQQNFNGQIIRTDGKRIAEEMKAKMEVIFSENVLALKVILITRAQLRHLTISFDTDSISIIKWA